MRMLNRKMNKGFTLIELMIVVAIVGILAVLAVVGVRRYLSNAKSAEARNSLGAIGKGAAQALERETNSTAVLGAGGSGSNSRALCTASTGSVPSAGAAAVQGKKYQANNASGPTAIDYHKDDSLIHTGFACLRFEMVNPQAYVYQYYAPNVNQTTGTMSATAIGDLNGDAVTSLFRIEGSVQAGALTLAPSLFETNPDE